MKVEYKESFKKRFNKQLDYIASDSPAHARAFRDKLKSEMNRIKQYPMTCRKSIYFDDENIRDFIFKGYTITFKIWDKRLEVFGFTKFQQNL